MSSRPVTSKVRGICKYNNAPRGCFAGDNCKFLHVQKPLQASEALLDSGDLPLLTPYDKAKRCRYFEQGFCKRGDTCWFLHKPATTRLDEDDEELCSICFEKPSTYGLLEGCSHIFCMDCIKQWRDPQNKPGGVLDSGNTKRCPMCRTPSTFITPSSRFYKNDASEKSEIVQSYKGSMGRVPCRYFQKSLLKNKRKPTCPYGKDCFYQHLREDGTSFVFKDGVDVCMTKYRRAHWRDSTTDDMHFIPFFSNVSNLDILLPGMAGPTMHHIGVDGSQGDENSMAYAARRLNEVRRSLEVMNNAIGDRSTLEDFNLAVEDLRARLEIGDGVFNGRSRATEDTADQQENDVIQHLGRLADQMLASLTALPITPGDRDGADLPSLAELVDDSDSEDSIPGLASVSNSSEDCECSDDGSAIWNEDTGDAREISSMNLTEIFSSVPESASRTSPRLTTVVDRPLEQSSDAELPALEPADQGSPPSTVEPPFVTDGRGRVVWTRAEEENRSRVSNNEVPEPETGGSRDRPGRSIFDWINALF